MYCFSSEQHSAFAGLSFKRTAFTEDSEAYATFRLQERKQPSTIGLTLLTRIYGLTICVYLVCEPTSALQGTLGLHFQLTPPPPQPLSLAVQQQIKVGPTFVPEISLRTRLLSSERAWERGSSLVKEPENEATL